MKVNRNFAYLGVALLLGLVAAFAAVRYVQGEVAKRTNTEVVALTRVAVPNRDLAAGELIDENVLAIREVPADLVPADAMTPDNYEAQMGRVLRAPVRQGAPFSASALVPLYEQFSSVIADGNVGYTLQVDETNSISGMVAPGDHLDVFLSVDADGAGTRVLPLLENINVLATGTRIGDTPVAEDGANYSTITLELQPAQAERLTVADKAGSLRMILRQRDDREGFQLKGLTEAALLRTGGSARTRSGGGVEFIIGGRG